MSVPQISLSVQPVTDSRENDGDAFVPDVILLAATSGGPGASRASNESSAEGAEGAEPVGAQLVGGESLAAFGLTASAGDAEVGSGAASGAAAAIADALAQVGATGQKDSLVRLPAVAGPSIPLAVIGLGASLTADSLRYAVGSAVRQLAGTSTVAVAIPTNSPDELAAVAEGAALGAYAYREYRSASLASHKPGVETVVVLHPGTVVDDASPEAERIVARATAVAEAVSTVKNLVHMPPSDLYPETLADAALAAIEGVPIEATVWNPDELVADGFGGIVGVGQGSTRGPRLVKLSYAPAEASAHLALVGKGITFDTGGLSLKPASSMVGMKYDMAGAASVLAVIVAAARLELPVRLTSWMCIAENMPSGSAMRPNDVLTIRGGTTVEINNTDAEGRLVLADGLVAASEEHPDAIIDIATLTGAQQVALGNRYSGLMGDDSFVARVKAAADAVDEPMWQMPFAEELRKNLNSSVADLQNAKLGTTAGGMLLAGLFLREFIGNAEDGSGRIPWAHVDTAGPSNNTDAPYGFTGTGPTASGVRTLLKVAEEFSRP